MSAQRAGNYAAFYVDEPFSPTTLGAHATDDFRSYNLLRSWKGKDSKFPFTDSHATTYNVRDGSDWEATLKPRLRSRLRNSKNIVLFLSSITRNSRALREEIDYGVNDQELPVIVVYPEFKKISEIASETGIKSQVSNLWDHLPVFRKALNAIPSLHVPMDKSFISAALSDVDFVRGTTKAPKPFFYAP